MPEMTLDELNCLHTLLGKYCNFMENARKRAKNSDQKYVKKYISEDCSSARNNALRTKYDVEVAIRACPSIIVNNQVL